MDILIKPDKENPKQFLARNIGKNITVNLKWDEYFNLHLKNCKEKEGDVIKGDVGEIVIRCNNVRYIAEHNL
ncbi:small nuclear ribonucleoprotein F [Hamiltosporidium tvaerminnensis]|uniref:Small nuclear ribonucleoprotein F n=1 Tax=Hamiltosporidium tvaerminnensis TaxID=1176355 RepID=A0A4Q9LY29_9MICR|nr:small nuclear ribonucleoprotein F [Hamiltosporidium tvaerminnensis]